MLTKCNGEQCSTCGKYIGSGDCTGCPRLTKCPLDRDVVLLGDTDICNQCGYTPSGCVFEPEPEPEDLVNHPNHYCTGQFECIDVMMETMGVEAVKNFCICNAFKYLYRHKNKNGTQDIDKAIWYLNKYKELED